MNLPNKLRTANVLMLLGIVPLLVGIYTMLSAFPTLDYNKQSHVGDGLIMLGTVMFAYAFAVIVSGTSALWSAVLEKRHAGIHVGAAKSIRILVLIVLVVPLVLKAL